MNIEQTLIYQKIFVWKSAIFQPIKLPFDAEAAERILKVIYWVYTMYYGTGSRSLLLKGISGQIKVLMRQNINNTFTEIITLESGSILCKNANHFLFCGSDKNG